MACSVTSRDEVAALVIAVIRANTGEHDVDEDTDPAAEFGWDDATYDEYYTLMVLTFQRRGCTIHFGPGVFRGTTVGEMIDLIWNDLRQQGGAAVSVRNAILGRSDQP